VHERRQDNRKITSKTQQGYIGAVIDPNDETRAIGDAVIILTNGSKQFRFDGVEIFRGLKDRFALCGSKLVVALIT
jgi:hypothetical protein